MRFLELRLEKFGSFEGRVLRFRPGARLHVVHGANEAGKSTALDAARALLFGFPERTSYDFKHKTNELRIGGEIEARDGRRLAFVRRKGRTRTLADPSGGDIPDDALAPFLGGLTAEIFDRAFGLDADRLRKGANELLAARGEVSASLMAAASGLRGLSELRRNIEAEADAIFAERKSEKRRFYQALDRVTAASKAIRDGELRAGDWNRSLADIDSHSKRLGEIASRRADIAMESTRLARLARLAPLARTIDAELAKLDALGPMPELPADFGARLAQVFDAIALADSGLAKAKADSEAAEHELNNIAVDRALLARDGDIVTLFREHGSYLSARRDRPRVQIQADGFNADAARLATSLGLVDVDDLVASQPTAPALATIRQLISEGVGLSARARGLDEALVKERAALAGLDRARRARGALIDPEPLHEKLAALGGVGALVERRRREASEGEAETRQLAEAAARLTPPVGDLDALARAAMPGAETLARFRKDFESNTQAARDARAEVETARREVERLDARIKALAAGRPVPSADLIGATRGARDSDWTLLRATLFGEANALSGKSLASVAARFEKTIAEADRLADEALRDAERVSAHAAASLDLVASRRREEIALEHRAEIKARELALRRDWTDAWAPLLVTPLSPVEMSAWLAAIGGLLDRRAKLATRRAALEELDAELAGLMAPLAAIANEAGVPKIAGLDAGRLAGAIANRLKTVAISWQDARDEKRRRSDTLARIEDAEREINALATALDDWSERWGAATPAIGLAPEATREAAAAALDVWKEAPGVLEERVDRIRRVAGMARDMEAFEVKTATLVDALAPDLSRLSSADAVEALHERLARARQDDARRGECERRKVVCDENLAAAQTARASANVARGELAAMAPRGVALEPLREKLAARGKLTEAIGELRHRFIALAEGHDEAHVRAELADFDPDRAEAIRASLAEEERRLDQESKEVFAERKELERRRGEREIAMGAEIALQQRRNAETELRQAAREWAVLKTSSLLVEAALERHRAGRVDPLLQRAGDLFSTLTGGAFSGLDQEFDETDEPRLAGRRANGERVPVEAMREAARSPMSTATLDQLYLSLRLAYVEDYATRAESAPFVGDDLFTSFDDARTGYGLDALALLGDRLQPILFTHHRHVVDAAGRRIGADLDVIELS